MMTCGAICCVALSASVAYPTTHKSFYLTKKLNRLKEKLKLEDPCFRETLNHLVEQCEILFRVPNAKGVSRKLKLVVGEQNARQNKKMMKISRQAQRRWNRGGKNQKRPFDNRGFITHCSRGGGKR